MRQWLCLLLSLAAGMFGCTPSRTGVIGNTFTTNTRPAVSVHVDSRLVLLGNGKLHLNAQTDVLTERATVTFDFAVFMDAAGPDKGIALAAVVDAGGQGGLRIRPPVGKSKDAFAEGDKGPADAAASSGLGWKEELLCLPFGGNTGEGMDRSTGKASGDWLAELLEANRLFVPARRLTARWTAGLSDAKRVVVEYSEPWPDWIEPEAAFTPALLPQGAGEYLQAFADRARGTFTADRMPGDFRSVPEDQPSKLILPRRQPDLTALVGEIISAAQGR